MGERAVIVVGLVFLGVVGAGCGRWARTERVAIHTGAAVEAPGVFFDRVVAAVHEAGYDTANEDRGAGIMQVRAHNREAPGTFVVRLFMDGSVEVIAQGEERRRRVRRTRDGQVLTRVIRTPLYEESLRFADRLARELDAAAMTEQLARRRVEAP